MPYRTGGPGKQVAREGGGIVADMVRQFADPYAFLRELVQNGLDAGARKLEVRLEWEPGGLSVTSVSDDGCGMSREVVTGSLLVLFASTKEGAEGMIGKYGVGFVSVFALEPEEVVVRTARAGESWTLRLFPDHRYELATGEPRAGSGTTVSLLKRMSREHFDAHAARVHAALWRWCRHAPRPLSLVVAPGGEPARRARVDEALGVRSVLAVEAREGRASYVVGIAAGAPEAPSSPRTLEESLPPGAGFGGFYRGGLTLHETADLPPGFAALRFKVESPALSHTLSRDDVRRDAAFEEAVARVGAVARGELRAALVRALGEEASRVSRGEAPSRYLDLLGAALGAPFGLSRREIAAPLVDPIDGARTISVEALGRRGEVLAAEAPDPLTAALAASGRPVVRLPASIASALAGTARRAHEAFTLVGGIPPGAGSTDEALCAALGRVLEGAGAPLARVALGRAVGAPAGIPWALVPAEALDEREALLAGPGEIEARLRRLRRKDALLLLLDDELVEAARSRAARGGRQPAVAAALLARALLLEARGPAGGAEAARLAEACRRALSAPSGALRAEDA